MQPRTPPASLALISLAVIAALLPIQFLGAQFQPPASKQPPAQVLKEIKDRTNRLGRALGALQKQGLPNLWLPDVEVYYQAATKIVELDEFFQTDSADWTLDALDRGLLRAKFMAQGEFPWVLFTGFPVVRGYRSRIDDSVQPYAVTFPHEYFKDPLRRWRLDVVLHGRDTSLNEVKFLARNNGAQAAPKGQDFIRLDIFGRGNNAYRWAGETDVFEALESFLAGEEALKRHLRIDADRVVLRGFSMGGAGTWHIGLHRPDRWCVIGPGAGFTTTHGYAKLPAKLPPHQEACLKIYDAVDYAENAFNVPVVAYSGSQDAQKLAADLIEAKLKPLGIPMTHLVADGLGHKFPAEWEKKAQAIYARYAAKGREEYPKRVRFVTHTMRYSTCAWVEVLGLKKHYDAARVVAESKEDAFEVTTANIRALRIGLAAGFGQAITTTIDGQKLTSRPWINPAGHGSVYLENRNGSWTSVLPQRLLAKRAQSPQKISGLQGPIDDAFADGFVCVRGTGEPWHQAVHEHAERSLKRFQGAWARYWRGQLPVTIDTEVTTDEIAAKHLVLFGDPGSNWMIRQVLDGLPLTWTRESIVLGGQKYSAHDHLPVLIFPNPLNPARYVVLNTGHTFHEADYRGTNALLYPRLGDYAMLRLTDNDPLNGEVRTAGLFNEFWRVPGKD
ncbi:MAG: hypothetical protein FJ271_16195 [Planctomycetes bacterium]|nr:hypothetical protein [Planctomycetota bacterium]